MELFKKLPPLTIGLIVTLLSFLHSTIETVARQGTTQSYLEIGPRIISGKPTTIQKHPYSVRVMYYFASTSPTNHSTMQAQGALLTLKWVLTAAHVVDNTHTSGLQVVAGMTGSDDWLNQSPHVQIEGVCLYVIHPLYKYLGERQNYLNDLAVVKLRGAFRSSPAVRALGFASIPNYYGDPLEIFRQYKYCTAVGWGDTEFPDQVQEARFYLVNTDDCLRLGFILPPTTSVLCTHSEHAALFEGDSGTPLICRGGCFLAIYSGGPFTLADEKRDRVNTYTRVDYWKGWIMDIITYNS